MIKSLRPQYFFLSWLACIFIFQVSCKSPQENKSAAAARSAPFELEGFTIDSLQEKLKNGVYSSRQITQMYLDRIQQIDVEGPGLRSVIEVNPDALAIADSMDRERKENKIRGPLHGIPVLIKDNIDTGDKMQTTAGSIALEGNKASKDAFVVQQLRKAGAIIIGKTNLSEWANFRSTRSSSGWSSRGGQTKNPYVLDRSPCGSSSGSGVAVAADLCVVAVGTETDGSIACPASLNGVVGIKPTVGLVSRSGIIPISKTQDTAGPFGRTVKDAAILLSAMTGVDSLDISTLAPGVKSNIDYTTFLNPDGMKGKRIGVEKSLLHRHEGIDSLLWKALEQMEAKGATIVEVEFHDQYNALGDEEYDMMKYEFKEGLNKYLAVSNGKVKSLAEVIQFNASHTSKAMPYFKQEIMDSSEVKGGLDQEAYKNAISRLQTLRKFIDDLMSTNKLDALCGPATGPAWCIDLVNGDHWTGYGAYGAAAVTGYPSITVPMGMVHEMPVGISFMGRAFDEGGLLAIAYAYEQVSKHRTTPKFLPTVSVRK
jgi:amidase